MLDRETVERLLQNNLDAKLNSELSKYGYQLDAAHKLFRFITSIFERTPPELITWKFKVIMPVGDWDFSQKIILNFHRMNEVFTSECAFIIVDSNLYLIEPYEADYSGRDHICYQYNAPQNESLTIKDKQFQLSEYYDSAITSILLNLHIKNWTKQWTITIPDMYEIPRAQCFHKYGQTRLKENLFKNQNISCETLYGSAYRIFYGTILSSGSKLLMQHIPLTLK